MHQQLQLHSPKETLTEREVALRARRTVPSWRHTYTHTSACHAGTAGPNADAPQMSRCWRFRVQITAFGGRSARYEPSLRRFGKGGEKESAWYSSNERGEARKIVLNGWDACAFVLTKHTGAAILDQSFRSNRLLTSSISPPNDLEGVSCQRNMKKWWMTEHGRSIKVSTPRHKHWSQRGDLFCNHRSFLFRFMLYESLYLYCLWMHKDKIKRTDSQ